MTTNMDDEEDVLFQDFLCKLKQPKKGRFSLLVQERWKTKYFVLCCRCDHLVLKYYNKKPKQLNSQPKKQMSLKPSFKVEKLSNAHNRAFAVELTARELQLQVCLSADEQSTLDLFVFLLQTQVRLRHSITDNLTEVTAEPSDSFARVGAKGAKCLLHVSPWGLTVTLRWPLKSVRYYESSGQGQFTIHAGMVAPMGEGVYTFHTLPGLDNQLYDAVDHFVINTLDRVKPNQRGTEAEIQDYLREFDCLHSLTELTPLPVASIPEVVDLLRDNWNTSPQALGASRATSREKSSSHDLHTSSTPALGLPQSSSSSAVPQLSVSSSSSATSSSTSLLVSDNTNRPLPSPLTPRSERHRYSPRSQQHRESPRQQRASPGTSRSGGVSEGRVSGRPPFAPSSRQTKGSPQSSRNDSVDGLISSMASDNNKPEIPMPRRHSNPASVTLRVTHDEEMPAAVLKQMSVDGNGESRLIDDNLSPNSPRSPPGSGRSSCPVNSHGNEVSHSEHKLDHPVEDWLVSASCEDLSDHMRAVIFQQRYSQRLAEQATTSEASDLLSPASPENSKPVENGNPDFIPPPFTDIKGFSTAVELEQIKSQQARDRSQSFDVNAKGRKNLHGGAGNVISSGSPASPSVRQIRKLVSARKATKENLRKSLSNPNYLNLGSKEKLYQHRLQATKSTVNLHDKDDSPKLSVQTKHKSRSLVSLLPSTVRRYISRESLHPASSSPSPNTQHRSRHLQQYNDDGATLDGSNSLSLQRQNSQQEMTVKGIRFTERSRSFRRPKDYKRSQSADPLDRVDLDSAEHLGELSPTGKDGDASRFGHATTQSNGSIDANDCSANIGDPESNLRARNAAVNGVRPLPPKPDWKVRVPSRTTSQTSC